MNTELLLKVRRHILQRPSRLRMSNWIIDALNLNKDPELENHVKVKTIKGKKILDFQHTGNSWNEPLEHPLPECNTVGCIAGWVCILSDFKTRESLSGFSISDKAITLLGISNQEADRLFFVNAWPPEFRDKFMSAATKTAKQRAKITADRIQFFIKTNGTDREWTDDEIQ